MEKRINKLKRIMRLGLDRGKVEGVYLDNFDAQMSVQVLTQLPDAQRRALLALEIDAMVGKIWEIVNKAEKIERA